uniref:Multidrug and toxic compound extrusion protein n=1 Tax=Chrysotila carterae TaxID=13221 RepID=A0A7S4F219_CHRCT
MAALASLLLLLAATAMAEAMMKPDTVRDLQLHQQMRACSASARMHTAGRAYMALADDDATTPRANLSKAPRQKMLARRALFTGRGKPALSSASGLTADSASSQPGRISVFPCGDALDRRILSLSAPAIVNFLILPVTQSVDLFWVGRMGTALATAGQAAANQVFSTAFWLTNFIPTITTPQVAAAAARGDDEAVQRHVGEAIFLSAVLGVVLTAGIALFQTKALLAIGNSAGLGYSQTYLRYRLPGVVADAISIVGFAAFRGVLDTVTPLKVALVSNLLNIALDPLLMFPAGLGIAGAAVATSVSQIAACLIYVWLLLRRRLVKWSSMLRMPSRASLNTLAKGGVAVQIRAIALNVAFVAVTRSTQRLDATGTGAAAHAVAMQLWQLGGVILFAVSTVASIVVPAELNREGAGKRAARAAASRLLAIGLLLGSALAAVQLASSFALLGVFSPLPEVQAAAKVPSVIGSLLQVINGVTFIGEGVMIGTGSYTALAAGQVAATAALLVSLSFATSLPAVWIGFWIFNGVRLLSVLRHHFLAGPLARARLDQDESAAHSSP